MPDGGHSFPQNTQFSFQLTSEDHPIFFIGIILLKSVTPDFKFYLSKLTHKNFLHYSVLLICVCFHYNKQYV